MAFGESLGQAVLQLVVDSGKLKEGLSQANKETQTTVGKMASLAASTLGRILTFGALTAVIKKSVDAYAAQEQAERRLQTAFEATGNFSRESVKQFAAYSSAIQAATGHADDLVIEMGGLLLNLGVAEDKLQRAASAGIDLSAALDIDLRAAMMLIGRAATGNVELFSRYGVVLDADRAKTEGLDFVLGELEARFKGQAAANIDTFTGRLKLLGAALGDLAEAVGRPIGISGGGPVTGATAFVTLLTEGLDGIFAESEKAGKSLGNLVVDFLKLQPQTKAVMESFSSGLKGLEERAKDTGKAVQAAFGEMVKQHAETAEIIIKRDEEAAQEEAGIASKIADERERIQKDSSAAMIRQHAETAEIMISISREEADREAEILSRLAELRKKSDQDMIAQHVATAEIIVRKSEEDAQREADIASKLAVQRRDSFKEIEKGFGSAAERGVSDFLFHLGDGTKKGISILEQFGLAAKRVVTDAIAQFAKETFIAPAISAVSSAARGLIGFASGGLVEKPTVALLGEAGPEVVLPLKAAGEFVKGSVIAAAKETAFTEAASKAALEAGLELGVEQAGASAATAAGLTTSAALFVFLDAINAALGGQSAIRAIGDIAFGERGKQGLIEKGLGALGIKAFRKKSGGEFNIPSIQAAYAEALAEPPFPPFSFNELMARIGRDDIGLARAALAPYLGDAEGRFVTGASLRLLGEDGPEHVLNVDSPASIRALTEGLRPIMQEMFEDGGAGGGRMEVRIPLILDGRAIMEVSRSVDTTLRRLPRTQVKPRPSFAGV